MIAFIITTLICISSIVLSTYHFSHFHWLTQYLTDSALIGLSLTSALNLTAQLNGVMTYSAETEREMISVERVTEINQWEQEYSIDQIKPEKYPSIDGDNFAQLSDSEVS